MTQDTHALQYWEVHQARYEFLQQYLKERLLPGAKILDVGCYPPFLLDWLEQNKMQAYGVASQHEKIEQKQVKILNIDRDKFPWEDQMFDVVIFTEVLEHLPFSPQHALKEMQRVLKKNGLLVLSTPNSTKLQNRVRLLAGKSITFPLEQLLETAPGSDAIYHRHNREYTKTELEQLITRAGFAVIESSYQVFYPPTRKKVQQESTTSQLFKWLGYIPQQLYPPFRDSLFLVAKA